MSVATRTKSKTPPPPPRPADLTVAALLDRLGGIPPERVWLQPPPGTATEKDVIEIDDRFNRHCELIDGVLVEKTMGYLESRVAFVLGVAFDHYLTDNNLGAVTGEGGTIRLLPGQVRIPDVGFYSWDRFPGRKVSDEPIPDLVPDLAVEVLSKSNTKREMDRKLCEYFEAGTSLVWYIDPKKRTVRVYTSPKRSVLLTLGQALDGGAVLPGFTLALQTLFDRAERGSR